MKLRLIRGFCKDTKHLGKNERINSSEGLTPQRLAPIFI